MIIMKHDIWSLWWWSSSSSSCFKTGCQSQSDQVFEWLLASHSAPIESTSCQIQSSSYQKHHQFHHIDIIIVPNVCNQHLNYHITLISSLDIHGPLNSKIWCHFSIFFSPMTPCHNSCFKSLQHNKRNSGQLMQQLKVPIIMTERTLVPRRPC